VFAILSDFFPLPMRLEPAEHCCLILAVSRITVREGQVIATLKVSQQFRRPDGYRQSALIIAASSRMSGERSIGSEQARRFVFDLK
jgi:hypothetical protein